MQCVYPIQVHPATCCTCASHVALTFRSSATASAQQATLLWVCWLSLARVPGWSWPSRCMPPYTEHSRQPCIDQLAHTDAQLTSLLCSSRACLPVEGKSPVQSEARIHAACTCPQGPLGPAEMVQALSAAAETHGAEFVADRADAHARVSTPGLSPTQFCCSFPCMETFCACACHEGARTWRS